MGETKISAPLRLCVRQKNSEDFRSAESWSLECLASILEKRRRFAGFGEVAAALFFPDDLAVLTDFKNAPASGDELGFVADGLFDFSRHTVGFGKVVSLRAIFDLELHGGILEGICDLASEFMHLMTEPHPKQIHRAVCPHRRI